MYRFYYGFLRDFMLAQMNEKQFAYINLRTLVPGSNHSFRSGKVPDNNWHSSKIKNLGFIRNNRGSKF